MAPIRRVSYVIPSPSTPIPTLTLPAPGVSRNGRTGPILIPSTESGPANGQRAAGNLPKHRLPVAAFSLDTTTLSAGNDRPEGILYTGGRDGMLMAWDLNLPMKSRETRYGYQPNSSKGRWDLLTRDEDDENAIYEEDDDDWPISDGDILGDVLVFGRRRRSSIASNNEIPYEQRWELDAGRYERGQHPSIWRQGVQAHTDWINDILLCNMNQTVVSASSDGTVKAWNPHTSMTPLPSTIGVHSDYVRCLALSSERNWIASGSFDRTVKLWDITRTQTQQNDTNASPLMTLLPPDAPGPKSSVYALATDPSGHLLATGGPERVVRTWDPRSGKRTGKLVGHTDNIRAILMSEDSRYLLTGSADASVKLWSLSSPQRCLHTFTHHTESVWSLFSAHPSLEIFYSGDRSGLVCRVDVEQCDHVSEGECIVLCKDGPGIGESDGHGNLAASEGGVSKVIAMDDTFIWTAAGSSSVLHWRVPPGRVHRPAVNSPDSPNSDLDSSFSPHETDPLGMVPLTPASATFQDMSPSVRRRLKGQSVTPSFVSSTSSLTPHIEIDGDGDRETRNGIPYASMVRLSAPHALSHTPLRGREAEVSTLYSAASVVSVPASRNYMAYRQAGLTSPITTTSNAGHAHNQSIGSRRDTLSPPGLDIPMAVLASPRAAYEDRDVAPDAVPFARVPDAVIAGANGLVRVTMLNDRVHALTVDTTGAVAAWDVARARCLGMFAPADVRRACARDAYGTSTSSDGHEQDADDERKMERVSPRQALEMVRERVEGEAVVLQWANADTKIGELTIHIFDRCFEAEVFADEVGFGGEKPVDDQRYNLGKWVLRNLFLSFIREEQRSISRSTHERNQPTAHRGVSAPKGHTRSHSESVAGNSNIPPIPALPGTTPSAEHPSFPGLRLQHLSPIAQSPANSDLATPRPGTNMTATRPPPSAMQTTIATTVPTPGTTATTPSATQSHDYFSLRRRPSTSQSASTGQTTAAEDDFSGWGGPGTAKHEGVPTTPNTPGGGFMNRLKFLGKSQRRAATEVETPSATGQPSSDASKAEPESEEPKPLSTRMILLQHLKSQPFNPPSASDAPAVALPLDTAIVVSEETSAGWMPVYRGNIASAGADMLILEEILPEWLLDFVFTGKTPAVPVTKINFVLLPAVIPPNARAEYGETLPELLNTAQSKLSASRFLRIRKLAYHVQDKLDRNHQSKPSTPRSSTDAPHGRTPPGTNAVASSPPTSRASTPRLSPNQFQSSVNGAGSPLPRADEVYEILCNDQVLSPDMTLAAVRQFAWRSASELVMHYRRKPRNTGLGATLLSRTGSTSTIGTDAHG